MFLPVPRRLLETDGSDVFNTSTAGTPSLPSGGYDSVYFGNSSFNVSVGMVDLGEGEIGFSDMQTVFLACILTLIPLVFILVAAIGVRFLWRRFRARKGEGYEGVLQRDESSDPLAVKSLSASGNLLTEELKTSESQFSVTPAEEIEDITSQLPLLAYAAGKHTSKSANGSIITMTLKNNHLIVETEERGVTLEDGATKTTTTKFTTSSSPHENNVFVVEVQQGGAPRTSDCFRGDNDLYPKLTSSIVRSQVFDEEEGARRSSSQRAQVHRPPDIDVDEVSEEDELEEVEEEDEEDEDDENTARNVGVNGSTNTGLSQSDLSISSSGSNNPSYRYGNQVGYEGGHFGYPQYVGYSASDEKIERTVADSDAKIVVPRKATQTTTAMKRASSVTESSEKVVSNPVRGRYSIDVTPRLLSDIQAIERLRQQDDDRFLEEQRQLGNGTVKALGKAPLAVSNGDTTPSPVEEEQPNDKSEDNKGVPSLQRTGSLPSRPKDPKSQQEEEKNDKVEEEEKSVNEVNEKSDGDGVSAGKKRASLPIITPELYTQIKQTTKSLILDKTSRPGLSPKFEKFRNENSPLDETEKESSPVPDTVPAKSQEYENEAFVPSDQITS